MTLHLHRMETESKVLTMSVLYNKQWQKKKKSEDAYSLLKGAYKTEHLPETHHGESY